MDCKYDIHTVLFRVNFRMPGYTEKLLMESKTRLRTQEWVLPTRTNTERRRVGLSILVSVGDSGHQGNKLRSQWRREEEETSKGALQELLGTGRRSKGRQALKPEEYKVFQRTRSMTSKPTMGLEGYSCGTDAKSLCEGSLKVQERELKGTM